jgi:hypothetical protein
MAEQEPALERLFAFARTHELDLTFVIWPLIPKAVTPETSAVTGRFKAYLEKRAALHGARVFDFQQDSPLVNEDFRKDLDHLEPWGDAKISEWARRGPLKYLETPLPQAAGSRPSEITP